MPHDSAFASSFLPCAKPHVTQWPPSDYSTPSTTVTSQSGISMQHGSGGEYSWPQTDDAQPSCWVPFASAQQSWIKTAFASPQRDSNYIGPAQKDPRVFARIDRTRRLNGLRASYRQRLTHSREGDAVPLDVLTVARLAVSELRR
eukprot:TRINITY_DN34791_c0_g1_i1.p2 TRINITY_DN34791_c0_g1~~TRINITY_DN34791_c0_g1_i1.p2  ORF type:complete len:145 (-),score=9.26 TRINITY_DN34791_c0_g1_i1:326-760(-)